MKILRFFKFLLILLPSIGLNAQNQHFTRTAHLHIKTSNRFTDIIADNYQVYARLDIATGQFEFSCLLKSFEFQLGAANRVLDSKALDLSEHPKASFQGQITNLDQIDFSKPGDYNVVVQGTLFIWEEKRITSAEATLSIKPDGSIFAKSNFKMIIEEKNMEKANRLINDNLPDLIDVDTHMLGISRYIFHRCRYGVEEMMI